MTAVFKSVVNIRKSDIFMLHLVLLKKKKMSKLSFRARALDASKPLPVFRCEDLPDLHEYASINRAVPQMPTGMEKEEESVRLIACIYTFRLVFPIRYSPVLGCAGLHKMAVMTRHRNYPPCLYVMV